MDNTVSMTYHVISLFANKKICRITLDETAFTVLIMSWTIFDGVHSRIGDLQVFRMSPVTVCAGRGTGTARWERDRYSKM
jgi:hypothetical protein